MIAPWLTSAEFMAAEGMALRTFRRKCDTLITIKQGGKLMVSAESLSAPARERLDVKAPKPAPVARKKPTPAPARTTELALTPPLLAAMVAAEPRRRVALNEEQQAEAKRKHEIILPLIEFVKVKESRGRFSVLRLLDGSPVKTARDLAAYLAQTHSSSTETVSEASIWRWKKQFEEQGLSGLARKVREDKGTTKWAPALPELAHVAEVTFLKPHSTKQSAYDAVVKEAARLGIHRSKLPSYASVCDYLAALPAPAVVWAREGNRAHNERMSGHLKRDYTTFEPNQVWVADTMIHDTLVRNDCFGECDNRAIRLQLTALMDMRSRKIVGYTWCENGSGRSITTALMNAIRIYGPCLTFYCDNGKDFRGIARNAKRAEFSRPENLALQVQEDELALDQSGVLRRLGIAATFCIPYRPQSKPIERFFGTLHKKLDVPFPHYTHGNFYKRPDATIAAAKKHGKVLEMGLAEASPLMPASHFIRMAALWIEQEYNAKHEHGGHGMNGLTPNEVFAPALDCRREFDMSILDTLLWKQERRLVRKSTVLLQGRRMIGTDAFSTQQLYLRNDEEVIVCFDPNNPELGVIADLDGHKICDVRAETLVGYNAEGHAMIGESLKLHRGLRNATADAIRSQRQMVAASGHKPASQVLYEEAMLPMAVNDHITQRPAAPEMHSPGGSMHIEDIAAWYLDRQAGGK